MASLTGITGPTFVAIDANRTIGGTTATWLYVSEHGNTDNTGGGRVLRYNLTSGSTTPTVVATRGTANGQFIAPDGILVDAATGDLFVADRAQDKVQRIHNDGTFVMSFGSGTAGASDEMHGPTALARDSAGNIYVTEHGETLPTTSPGSGGSYVSKYTSSGTRVWRIGGIGSGNGQFANTGPYGAAVSGSNLLVSDGYNSRVQTFDLNGNYLSQFAIPNTLPLGLSLDSSGNLWIAESSSNGSGPIQQVQKASITGTWSGVNVGNSSELSLPFDAAIDTTANRAYVADYGHGRVAVYDLSTTTPPPTGSAPTITSSTSASGTVGQNFTFQVTATNSPTSYSVDALPSGLTLNTSTGAIAGIPTVAGTTTAHVTATNSSGTSSPSTLTITIAAATSGGTPGTAAAPLGPTITHFDVSSFTRGVGGDVRVTFDTAVTGVDVSDFAVHSQGGANAVITGVAADTSTANSYLVHFTYTDADGWIQWGIKTSGTGITDSSGNAFRGSGITATTTYGTGPTNGAISKPAATATLSAGTPSGNNVNFNVTFSAPVTNVAVGDFIVTGTSATVNSVTDSGDHVHYTVSTTASGTGTVSLNVIGGVTANIQDAATNWFGGNATAASAVIAGSTGGGGSTGTAPGITSASTATATVGSAFTYQITASGSPTSYGASNLTGTGLSVNTSTGLISGTPTASGTITSQLTATNATGTSTPVTLTITVNAAAPAGSAPTVTSSATATATAGSAFNYQIAASGSPTSYGASNLTGTGLSVNTSTGVISGTPTASGTITSQLTATNAYGTSTPVTLTITVNAAPPAGSAPTVTSSATANATAGSAFSYQITASGSATSYAASNLAGTGLSVDTSTGLISGTPTASGTITSQLTATNAFGTSVPVTLTITVASAPPPPPPPPAGTPVVTSASMSLTAGIPMVYTVQATNSPTAFTLTNGPSGLSISKTGVISGTPFSTGTFNATVTATNSVGTGTGTVTFNISASSGGGTVVKKGQTVIFNSPVSTVFVGDSFALSAQDSSGLPITYAIISGNASLSGNTLLVTGAGPVVVRAMQAGNDTYLPANADVTITVEKRAQQISIPATAAVHTDAGYTLPSTSSSGLPISYQVVSGPATINGNTVTFTGSGTVVVQAVQDGNGTYAGTTGTLTLSGTPVPRLVNISSRLMVSKGDANGASIAGFVVTGTAPKQILIRAVGPSLSGFHLNSPLADPTLKLYDAKGNVVATNSGWSNDAKIKAAGDGVGAFDLTAGSKDAAILATLQPGAYTVQVQSADNSGTVLIEVYDVSANAPVPTKQLINISTRGYVGSGDNVLIGGFAVSGNESKQVLVRAVGPTLSTFNVAGALSDPILTIYDAKGNVVAKNDNWGTGLQVASETPATAAQISAADTATGAFALPAGSKDAAVIVTLQPGQYTAIVTGANGATGAAMVEVYEIPNP